MRVAHMFAFERLAGADDTGESDEFGREGVYRSFSHLGDG